MKGARCIIGHSGNSLLTASLEVGGHESVVERLNSDNRAGCRIAGECTVVSTNSFSRRLAKWRASYDAIPL